MASKEVSDSESLDAWANENEEYIQCMTAELAATFSVEDALEALDEDKPIRRTASENTKHKIAILRSCKESLNGDLDKFDVRPGSEQERLFATIYTLLDKAVDDEGFRLSTEYREKMTVAIGRLQVMAMTMESWGASSTVMSSDFREVSALDPEKVKKNDFGEYEITICGTARRPKSMFPEEMVKVLEEPEAGSRQYYLARLRKAVLETKE